MEYVVNSIPTFSAVRRQPVAKRSIDLRRRFIKQVVTLLLVATVFSLLFVWTRVRVIQLGYDVSKIRKEVKDLTEQKNLLEALVASSKSPQRLENIAVERFGMRLPNTDEVVLIEAPVIPAAKDDIKGSVKK